jgi:hypothetical protein
MGKESSSDSKKTHSAYFRKQYFEFGEGEFLRFKEDSFYHTWGSNIMSLGKERISDSMKFYFQD